MARPTNEDSGLASRQAAIKEKQLSEMRKARRNADDQHQAMLNRITFLRSEEVKLDKDIEAAKRRALELLSRKAEKAEKQQDLDLATTAKDILEAVGPALAASGKAGSRPGTGRSSLRSSLLTPSLSAGPLTSATIPAGVLSSGVLSSSPSSPAQRSVSAQHSGRATASGQPLKPTKPSLSSPGPLGARSPSLTAGPQDGVAVACASPSHSHSPGGKPPLPHGTPPRPGSREAGAAGGHRTYQASPTRSNTTVGAATATAVVSGGLLHSKRLAASSDVAMQELDAGNVTGSVEGATLPRQQSQGHRPGGLNWMDTLGSSSRSRAAPDDTDTELIEELIAGSLSASGTAGQQQQQLQGLQQFSTEGATRVVHIKTARAKAQDGGGSAAGSSCGSPSSFGGQSSSAAVVMAAGVGWGLTPAGGVGGGMFSGPGSLADVDAAEQARLKEELAKKRKLRGVRKAFGLQPTPLQDASAQVVECGAGSWQ